MCQTDANSNTRQGKRKIDGSFWRMHGGRHLGNGIRNHGTSSNPEIREAFRKLVPHPLLPLLGGDFTLDSANCFPRSEERRSRKHNVPCQVSRQTCGVRIALQGRVIPGSFSRVDKKTCHGLHPFLQKSLPKFDALSGNYLWPTVF